jgi:GxxExxY protein
MFQRTESLTAETAETAEDAEVKLNELTREIIGAAVAVHRALGPGLLESTYEACLAYELAERGLYVERQKPLPVTYRAVTVDCGYRLDLLVERRVIVELKAVTQINPIHEAQLLSYLKLSGCQVGLLINFHVRRLARGARRLVNGFSEVPSASSALSALSAVSLSGAGDQA